MLIRLEYILKDMTNRNFLLMASQNIIAGTVIRWKKNTLNFADILRLQSVRIMYQENLYNTYKKAAAFFFLFFSKKVLHFLDFLAY